MNDQPQESRFGYQKESSQLTCEKCGRASELLYGIFEPPQGKRNVCAVCLAKHREKGGELASSASGVGEIAGGNQE